MDLAALKVELATDPKTLGYSGTTSEQAAALLNAATRTRYDDFGSFSLMLWATGGATDTPPVRSRIERIQSGMDHATPSIASACRAANILLAFPDSTLSLSLPSHQGVLAVLVAGGILLPAESVELYAIVTRPTSRAAELGFPPIRPTDIQRARTL